MSDELSTTTGLPELPEGFFYRIKKFDYQNYKKPLQVTVRQRRWYGSKEVGSALAYANKDSILDAANRARDEALRAVAARDGERDQFLGDYPPKVLS